MGFTSYESYLKSPTWHHIKQRVYEQKGRDCIRCKQVPATQIHHIRYDEDTMRGKTLNYLIPICKECHEKEHNLQEKEPNDAKHDAIAEKRRSKMSSRRLNKIMENNPKRKRRKPSISRRRYKY